MSGSILKVFWVCLIAVVITTADAGVSSKLEKTNRIVKGVNRKIEELPFMVQIRDSDKDTMCGGTLISTTHVLTAAHCFDPPNNITKELTVVAGATTRSEAGEQRKIASVSIHPEYENFYVAKGTDKERNVGSKADVAIIKLEKPFKETKKIKVKKEFCNGPISPKEFIEVSGWGYTKPVDPVSDDDDLDWAYSEELQSVRLPIISKVECSKIMKREGVKLSDTNVCAHKAGHDACVSDSGGPGICGGKICAVVSYGLGCAFGDLPGIYTSIQSVKPFIDRQLKA